MEYNLSLSEGLGKVLAWMDAQDGMWPAVAFRLLAVSQGAEMPPKLRTLAAHFQASPATQATRSKLRLQAPLVIEGVVTESEFKSLLHQWTASQAGLLDHWSVPPPAGLNSLWWQVDVPVAAGQFPLIEELPTMASIYRRGQTERIG
jgi:hypothetical protein